MKHPLTITDQAGNQHAGTLPGSWGDVPVLAYTRFAIGANYEARCLAMAELTGLPALAFAEDWDLLANLLLHVPYLYKGPLPAAELVSSFEHEGISYHHVGDLSQINAYQYEAALAALALDNEPTIEQLADLVPHLLALMYTPAADMSHAERLAAMPVAMASVPMSIGWPALMHLVHTIGPRAVAAQTCYTVQAQALQLVDTVQQQLLSNPPRTVAQKAAHALARKGLEQARKAVGSNYTPPKKKRK